MHADLNTIIMLLGFTLGIWRVERVSDKLDQINRTLGEHTADIRTLKENQDKKVVTR